MIVTKVQDPTGKWLSLDARFLKGQQCAISWVYAGALRSELSARLSVSWGPVEKGHADIDGVPEDLCKLFSQRDAQIEAKTAELVCAWVHEHDGAEPDAWAIARLERAAVLASRPGKQAAVEADVLRAEWMTRAREAGFEALALPDGQGRLPGGAAFDVEAVIADALNAVSAAGSTWLRADLAREIAALLPAEASATAARAVELVDLLAEIAAGRCGRRSNCPGHPEEAFATAIARPANARCAHAVREQLAGEAPEAPVVDDANQRMTRRLDQLQARNRSEPSLSL